MTKCLSCGQPLHYMIGKGWRHPNGNLYVTYIGKDGKVRDDHCACAVPDAGPDLSEEYQERCRRREGG